MKLHLKHILKASVYVGAGAMMVAPMAASAKVEVTPYLEAAQVLTAELKGGDDVLTYSSVAAGVDATFEGGRTTGQVSYRYERRFGWGKSLDDGDIHSGLARVSHELVRNTLALEAGAIATRSRSDIRGAAPSLDVGNVDNVTQVYSIFAGPSLQTNVNGLDVAASYRLGYTMAEANDFVPSAGQPRLDSFDDSVSHVASASVGMSPDRLPFGWKVSGVYEREDAGQLDQRFEAKGVRGEVIVPVTPTVALLGGVGYEDIKASERAPVLDVLGNPTFDSKGRFITNPASPRLASYDFDGLYWDVGVAWKPSNRTNLEAHVGRRYGSMSYTGSFTWQPSSSSAFQVGVYDQVETFGQQLTDSLSDLPTRFSGSNRNPLANNFSGCVAGGGNQTGGCLNPALQSLSGSVYRSRGVGILYSASRGPLSTGVGFGYAQRTFQAPNVPGSTFTIDGVKDESWYGQGNVAYQIDAKSAIDASVFASLYDSGILNAPDVLSTGATSSYNRRFGRNLSATAAVGLYSYKVDGEEGELNASALVGMRYSF
jgi:hypothetical protein